VIPVDRESNLWCCSERHTFTARTETYLPHRNPLSRSEHRKSEPCDFHQQEHLALGPTARSVEVLLCQKAHLNFCPPIKSQKCSACIRARYGVGAMRGAARTTSQSAGKLTTPSKVSRRGSVHRRSSHAGNDRPGADRRAATAARRSRARPPGRVTWGVPCNTPP
jgi:hypothetical protein